MSTPITAQSDSSPPCAAQDCCAKGAPPQTMGTLMERAIDAIPDVAFLKDTEGRYLLCNQAFADFAGLSLSETIGLKDTDLFPADLAAEIRKRDQEVFASGRPARIEEWISRPDGQRVLMDAFKSPLFNHTGQIVSLFGLCKDITLKRQTEDRQRESDANLDACLNSSSDFKLIVSTSGHILKANRKVYARLAHEPESLNGKAIADLFAPLQRPLIEKGIEETAAGLSDFLRVLLFRAKDGLDIPVEVEFMRGGWSGSPVLFVTAHDISEHLQTEEKLRQQGEIQRHLLLFATEFVNVPLDRIAAATQHVLATVGQLIQADRAYLYDLDAQTAPVFRKAHEWSSGGMTTGMPMDVIPKPLTSRIIEHLKLGVIHIPQVAKCASDDEILIFLAQRGIRSLIVLPIHTPCGCQGFVGFDTLTTERVWGTSEISLLRVLAEVIANSRMRAQTEQILKKRNSDMEMLLDTMDAHVWYLDNAETYGLVNRSHAEFLGHPRETLQRKPFRDFHPQEIAESCLLINREVFATGRCLRRQEWLVSKTGEPRLFEIVKTPSVAPDGKVAYVVCVAHDITEKSSLQQELIRSRDEAERTAELKARLLADMSHEIRTPLNVILGYLQIMDRECIDCPQKQNLKAMHKSGEHLLDLINDILTVLRHDSHQVTLNETAFDIIQMVEDIKLLFDKDPEAEQLSLETSVAPDVPQHIFSDKSKVRQILLNLVGNAVKFTERGFVRIRLSLAPQRPLPSQGSHDSARLALAIEIQDSGCGISEDKLNAIFEPFVRLDSGLTSHAGSGLGLTLSRRYARAMGGDITVKSATGQGSVFGFIFCTRAVDSSQLLQLTASPVRIALTDGKTPRILVVDDDPAGRDMQIAMLQLAGFDVIATDNGNSAISIVRKDPDISVVLLDRRMPELDGIETMKRILAIPEAKAVKVLLLSASGFKEESAEIQALGGSGVIPKPIKMDQLLEEIGRVTGVTYQTRTTGTSNVKQTTILSDAKDGARVYAPIPEPLRSSLKHALMTGNVKQLRDRILDLQATDPQRAEALSHLVESFDYDGLSTAIDERGNNTFSLSDGSATPPPR